MSIALSRPPQTGAGSPAGGGDLASGGGGSGWVELLVAKGDIEAHLLAGRLTEAGVEVSVVKDRSAPGAWLYGGSNPWAPVAVMVRKLQLTDAQVVLAEIAYEGPAREDRQVAARDWRTPVVWWSIALGLGMLMTGVALARTAGVMDRCDLPLLCSEGSGGR